MGTLLESKVGKVAKKSLDCPTAGIISRDGLSAGSDGKNKVVCGNGNLLIYQKWEIPSLNKMLFGLRSG
jgi:hypothetical protein